MTLETVYSHVSDMRGISLFRLFQPIFDFLNLTEKFQDDNHFLEIIATPPGTYFSKYPTLDNTAKQLLFVLRKAFHYSFGGGWFYLIFSCFLFLIFTDLSVVSDSCCYIFPRIFTSYVIVIIQSTEISSWLNNFA